MSIVLQGGFRAFDNVSLGKPYLLDEVAPPPVMALSLTDRSAGAELSSDGLTMTSTTSAFQYARGKSPSTSSDGKWYFEVQVTGHTTGTSWRVGLAEIGVNLQTTSTDAIVLICNTNTSVTSFNQSKGTINGLALQSGDRIMVAIDRGTGNQTRVHFGVNGIWRFSSNPAGNTGGFNAAQGNAPSGILFPYVAVSGSGTQAKSMTVNFGQTPFAYPIPNGFQAWQLQPYVTAWDPSSFATSALTLSSSNRVVASSLGTWHTVFAEGSNSTAHAGKYYWECSNPASTGTIWGFSDRAIPSPSNLLYPGSFGLVSDGRVYINQTLVTTIANFPASGVMGLAWDGQKVYVRVAGTWANGSNPVTGVGGYAYAPTQPVRIAMSANGAFTRTARFRPSDFMYAVPSGYSPWMVQPL